MRVGFGVGFGLLAFAACSSNSLAPITGSVTATFIAPSGDVTAAFDTSGYQYTAYAQDAAGDFTSYPAANGGAGSSDGTFTIDGVPDGPFLLKIVSPTGGTSWNSLDGATRELTSSIGFIGRPDAVPATKTMSLELAATGLDPWATSDELVADVWGNGTEIDDAQDLTPALTTGATTFDASFEWNNTTASPSEYSFGPTGAPYLMLPSEGDTLVVSRIATTTSTDGIETSTLTQVMNSAGVAQTDGVSASASGAFTEVTADRSLAIDLDFDALGTALGSAAQYWDVHLLAGPATADGFTMGPRLFDATQLATTAFAGSANLTAAYGDPFDPSWSVIVSATIGGSRDVAFPGAQAPVSLPFGISTLELVGSGAFTLAPVAPPSAITLNGIPIDERYVAWDGVSPVVLAATVPVTAAGFTAYVHETSVHDGAASSLGSVIIDSSTSAIVLPAELFTSGSYYTFQLECSNGLSSGLAATGKILIGPQAASVCGDGVVDPTTGETCDDGNTTSNDGCSATCQTE